jgi:hypothetical protein
VKKKLLDGWAMRFDGTAANALEITRNIWPEVDEEEIHTHYHAGYFVAVFKLRCGGAVPVSMNQWLVCRGGIYTCENELKDDWIDHGDGLTKMSRSIIFEWMNRR